MKLLTTGKRNFRRGASIMIALVIFLLCALAGMSAFLMAASNAGRRSHSEEQEYYTVSSAALVLVDMLDGLNYESKAVLYNYVYEWDFSGNSHDITEAYTLTIPTVENPASGAGTMSGATTIRTGGTLGLCEAIREQCDKLVPYLNIPSEWYARVDAPKRPSGVGTASFAFTVDVQDRSGNSNSMYETVDCKLVMSENYDLTLTFGGTGGEYQITVYWKATVTPEQVATTPTYEYADDASKVGDEYTKGKKTQGHTLTVKARWDKENVTISRGAVEDE